MILPLANAEVQTIGPFPQNQNINLYQICSNCTFNNISSIISPNGTKIITNVAMARSGTYYNYTLAQSIIGNTLGRYIVNGFGDLDGGSTVWSYDFFVTPSGKQIAQGESGIVIFLVITVFVTSLLLFVFGLFVPKGPLKLFLYCLAGIFLIGGLMFTITISQSYIDNNLALSQAYERFVFILQIFGVVVLILMVLFFIVKAVTGLKISSRFTE